MDDAVGVLREGLATLSPEEHAAVVDTLSEIVGALCHPLIDGNRMLTELVKRALARLPVDTEQAFAVLAMLDGLPLVQGPGPVFDPTSQVDG